MSLFLQLNWAVPGALILKKLKKTSKIAFLQFDTPHWWWYQSEEFSPSDGGLCHFVQVVNKLLRAMPSKSQAGHMLQISTSTPDKYKYKKQFFSWMRETLIQMPKAVLPLHEFKNVVWSILYLITWRTASARPTSDLWLRWKETRHGWFSSSTLLTKARWSKCRH